MPPVPQRKRRSAGSTIKGNIRSRSEEEKGAKESRHRLPPAPACPGAGWCGAAEETRAQVAAAAAVAEVEWGRGGGC